MEANEIQEVFRTIVFDQQTKITCNLSVSFTKKDICHSGKVITNHWYLLQAELDAWDTLRVGTLQRQIQTSKLECSFWKPSLKMIT